MLFIITTIYLLIRYFFFDKVPFLLEFANSFPFPFLVPFESNLITDFVGLMLSIIISYHVIKIIRLIINSFIDRLFEMWGKNLQMHKGWLRIHTLIIIVLICYFGYYIIFFESDTSAWTRIWATLLSFFVTVSVYGFLLFIFLWIKDGFKSNK